MSLTKTYAMWQLRRLLREWSGIGYVKVFVGYFLDYIEEKEQEEEEERARRFGNG